jgi:hypothetical protein
VQRHLAIVVCVALLAAGLGSAVLVAHAANTSSGHRADNVASARQFVGYWMGIDPLDGGDSRRGITRNNDRTFSVIGRDTVLRFATVATERSSRSVTRSSSARH